MTTHYENLKCLALEDARFRNGAMGLNVESASPTYALTMDLPGASSALMTARRLGLDIAIVDRASALIDPAERAFQTHLAKLETLQMEVESKRTQYEQARHALNEREANVVKREEKLQIKLTQLRDKANTKLLQEAQALRETVQKQSKALKRIKVTDKDVLQTAKRSAETAIQHVFDQRRNAVQEKAGPAPRSNVYQIGQDVFVVSLDRRGKIESLDLERQRGKVRCGNLSVSIELGDLRPVGRASSTKHLSKTSTPPSVKTCHKSDPMPESQGTPWDRAAPQSSANTVDVRGKTVDESIDMVAKFLDNCYLRNEAAAFIIHGHGGGHLKRAIRGWLTTCAYALDQRRGDRYEGGDGVTVVLLK